MGGRGGVVLGSGALCLLGFTLSAYALYVEVEKARDPSYKAFCDISPKISCSIVFTSKYGTGFGIISKILGSDSWLNLPNGFFGLIMYPVAFLAVAVPNVIAAWTGVTIGIAGLAMSLYLGYVLFFILEDACVVCISTYVVNLLYLYCTIVNYRALKSGQDRRKAVKKRS